jgi:sugar/nucleoside kinase (ribokinase family)
MRRPDLVVFGEVAADIILAGVDQVPRRWSVLGRVKAARVLTAGTAGYVAQCFSKLGGRASVAGKIGNDSIGQLLLEGFKRLKVSAKNVRIEKGASTEVSTVVVYRDGNKASMVTEILPLNLNEFDIRALTQGRAFHFAGYLFYPNLWRRDAASLFKTAKRRGLLVSADPQMSATGEWSKPFQGVLRHLDVLLLDEEEARRVSGRRRIPDAIKHFQKRGTSVVAVKTGARGCVVGAGEEMIRVEAFRVRRPVSTIGAGDAFDAAFIYGLLRNWSLRKTAEFANVAGAISTTEYGCMTAIPSASVVERTAEQYYKRHRAENG